MRRSLAAAVLVLSLHQIAPATAAEWYETAGTSYGSVSDIACSAVSNSSDLGKILGNVPFSVGGVTTTSRHWARMTRAQRDQVTAGAATGQKTLATATLGGSWPNILAADYAEVAGAKVPYWVQAAAGVGALPLPPLAGLAIGANLTLLDWALGPGNASQATANEVAVLIRSGGTLDRHYVVSTDPQGHAWLSQQLVFRTTVNSQSRAYILCSAHYPIELTS